MSYGYLGDTSSSIKQKVKNAGVLSVSDVLDLQSKGHYGGSLQLISSGSFSSSSALDLTDIKEAAYNVHVLQLYDLQSGQDNGYWGIQFYESGTLESGSVYDYSKEYVYTGTGTSGAFLSTTAPNIQIGHAVGTATNEKASIYCYIYNAGDASKFTTLSCHSAGLNGSEEFAIEYGGGALPQASTVDGFRILETERSTAAAATVSGKYRLYGIKQI